MKPKNAPGKSWECSQKPKTRRGSDESSFESQNCAEASREFLSFFARNAGKKCERCEQTKTRKQIEGLRQNSKAVRKDCDRIVLFQKKLGRYTPPLILAEGLSSIKNARGKARKYFGSTKTRRNKPRVFEFPRRIHEFCLQNSEAVRKDCDKMRAVRANKNSEANRRFATKKVLEK